jgi:hypothetical protein
MGFRQLFYRAGQTPFSATASASERLKNRIKFVCQHIKHLFSPSKSPLNPAKSPGLIGENSRFYANSGLIARIKWLGSNLILVGKCV